MSNSPSQVASGANPAETSRQIRDILHAHLRHSTRVIKTMDLTVLGCVWVAGVLGLWLVSCLLDHWVIPLPSSLRWTIWLGGVIGTAFWLVRWVAPLLFQRINPVYAARRIEQTIPEFKNGLVSWLELEQLPDHGVPKGIMAGLARHAARFLHGQDPASTVDSTVLIRLMSVVFFLTSGLVVYTMVSPKSVTSTGKRVLMPWLDLAAPTRVQILQVKPGACELTQGKPLSVSVELRGLSTSDKVAVKFSTVDGQLRDQTRPMQGATDGRNFNATVITGTRGIDHELDYWIEAGDDVAGPFRVKLNPLPIIDEVSIVLEFPKYTKLPGRTINGAPVQAIEGSIATIHAESNQTLERARIEINPELDARGELLHSLSLLDMRIDGPKLTGAISLRLNTARDNPTEVKYRLRGFNSRNDGNESPVIRAIKVLADLPPEVSLSGPDSRYLKVLVESQVNLEIRANDPDFGLSRIDLIVKRNGLVIQEKHLLDSEGLAGRQVQTVRLIPSSLGASVGDRYEISAVAHDNRHDPDSGKLAPNIAFSLPLLVEIVDARQFANEPPNEIVTTPEPNTDQQNNSEPSASGQTADSGTAQAGNQSAQDQPAQRPNSSAQPAAQDSSSTATKQNPAEASKDNRTKEKNGSTGNPKRDQTQNGKQGSSKQNSGKQPNGARGSEANSQDNAKAGSNSKSEKSKSAQSGNQPTNDEKNGKGKSSSPTSGQSGAEKSDSSNAPTQNSQSGGKSKVGKSNKSGASQENSSESQSGDSQPKSNQSSGSGGKSPKSQKSAAQSNSGGSADQSSDTDTRGNPSSSRQQSGNSTRSNAEEDSSNSSSESNDATQSGDPAETRNSAGGGEQSRAENGKSQKPTSDGDAIRRVEEYIRQRQPSPDRESQNESASPEQTSNNGPSQTKVSSKEKQSERSSSNNQQPSSDSTQRQPTGKADPSQSTSADPKQASSDAKSSSNSSSSASSPSSDSANSESESSPQSTAGNESTQGKSNPSASSSDKNEPNRESSASNAENKSPKKSETGNTQSASSDSKSEALNPNRGSKSKSNEIPSTKSGQSANKQSSQSGSSSKNGASNTARNSSNNSSSSGKQPAQSSTSGGKSEKNADKIGSSANETQPSTSKSGDTSSAGKQDSGKTGAQQDSSSGQSQSQSQSSAKSGAANSSSKADKSQPSKNDSSATKQTGKGPSTGQSSPENQSSSGQSKSEQSGTSQSGNSQSGNQPSGQSGSDSPSGEPSTNGKGTGDRPGSGSPSSASGSGQNSASNATQSQPANEQFSGQATQMALDYLARQKDQPDPELLKELNWTEKDLAEFLKRWEGARELANSKDPQDQRKWNEKLRDLGLQIRPAGPNRALSQDDSLRRMQESGIRIPPPESIRSQYEEFQKSLRESPSR